MQPSEIHDILGEIGTGKSTLIHTNFGVHHPDEGTILRNWQDTGRHVAVKLCM
ncbi:MAG: ATP-binding cassette domain-containing protein [Rhodobacteraceae bacterium]|nr:ATP-binding cassette domain-containing protein [Paracoccaceae bacterium]